MSKLFFFTVYSSYLMSMPKQCKFNNASLFVINLFLVIMQQVSTGTVKVFSTSCTRKMILTFMQNGISLQQVMGKALVMGLVRHVMLLNIRNNKILVYMTRA